MTGREEDDERAGWAGRALKSRFAGAEIPSVAKATLDEEVGTARLKPRPFKATTGRSSG